MITQYSSFETQIQVVFGLYIASRSDCPKWKPKIFCRGG